MESEGECSRWVVGMVQLLCTVQEVNGEERVNE